ncbi:MAG: Gfo/Idh/MocA family oxidoreductase [Verrucomicrobiales bacterium]|nr:Gfo/Idh/MocA family oxidoreductase [Verrucomicrobiales bacterium]
MNNKLAARNKFARRRFLQLTALAAGSAALGFPNLLPARGANEKLNVGFIGLGGQGRSRLKEILGCDVNVTALCDVDEKQTGECRKILETTPYTPKTCLDYRELLQTDLDAVVIATPDHWHAPIATAALKSGRHVFCEKPLAHWIYEARELRLLAQQNPRLVTQMGNQGSASPNMRRAIELIAGGVIGKVREVHVWVPRSKSFKPGQPVPVGEDAVPAGLHWDAWLGPAPFHPYKKGIYHPEAWRAWYDFGGGSIADWGCHGLNLPFRALKLDYPTRIETDVPGKPVASYPEHVRIRFDFAARNALPPLTIWWYDGGRLPPADVVPKSIVSYYGEMPAGGVLILGDKGFTFGAPHPGADYIQLADEKKLSGILRYQPGGNIPESLPHSPGHLNEWTLACAGGPPTFSSFEVGGHLTEIALSGVVALRSGKTLEWDGEKMTATNTPEAGKYIRPDYRTGWKI